MSWYVSGTSTVDQDVDLYVPGKHQQFHVSKGCIFTIQDIDDPLMAHEAVKAMQQLGTFTAITVRDK